jgi:hypothetical protein
MLTLTEMADKISFATNERQDGSTYDVARLWIGGVLFSADLMPHVETITRRIAAEAGLEIIDNRRTTAHPTN